MIQFLPVADITVPANRQRKEFDLTKHQELVESLQFSQVGLQNAVVVRREDGKIYLVSGERRLRAIIDIYDLGGLLKYAGNVCLAGCVPCVDVGELNALARMEAEFEENALRSDLTWGERAAAIAALWELRQIQADSRGEAPPTMADFIDEAKSYLPTETKGSTQNAVRQDLILARHLDNPAIKEAKSAKEAFRILKTQEKKSKNEELARQVGTEYTTSRHRVYNEDSQSWSAAQADGQFAVIVTDPPYGMGADEFGDCGTGAGAAIGFHTYADTAEVLSSIMEWFPQESYRLAAPDAHMYLFCDFDKFSFIKRNLEDAGWRVFRTPLIWSKPNAFRAPWPNKGPKRSYELILFAVKGSREVNKMGNDVIICVPDDKLGHNAQKPVALYTELLSRSAQPGDRVVDFFCGSGPIIPAAHEAQCYATAIELDPASYGIAVKCLENLL